MAPSAERSDTALFVARQPILDLCGRVFGYELLYRAAAGDRACTATGDLASARVLTAALLDLGLGSLTGGKCAFLNVTRPVLLDGLDTLLGPAGVVIELLENVAVDDDVIAACRHLKARGYSLALDDFVAGSDAEALLPYATYVKVDVLATPLDVVCATAARVAPRGLTLLAEKVESREVFDATRSAGFTLFQGYYFCRPELRAGAALPSQQLTYLRLLATVNKPNVTTAEIERVLRQDVSLSLRVLRSVNSAATPLRTTVRSIQQALLLLGIDPIRKWASVWCLAGLSAGATPELAMLALVRARACELLATELDGVDGAELFLVGLFSLLDAMLGRPMSDALDGVPVSSEAREALLGVPNGERRVLDAVIAYERADWNEAEARAHHARVARRALATACTEAYTWAHRISVAA